MRYFLEPDFPGFCLLLSLIASDLKLLYCTGHECKTFEKLLYLRTVLEYEDH